MKKFVADFLKANSKAIAGFLAPPAAAALAKVGFSIDSLLLQAVFVAAFSSAVVWFAPKNKE